MNIKNENLCSSVHSVNKNKTDFRIKIFVAVDCQHFQVHRNEGQAPQASRSDGTIASTSESI